MPHITIRRCASCGKYFSTKRKSKFFRKTFDEAEIYAGKMKRKGITAEINSEIDSINIRPKCAPCKARFPKSSKEELQELLKGRTSKPVARKHLPDEDADGSWDNARRIVEGD